MKARQARALALPSLRATGWPALVGAALAAAGLLTLPGPGGLLLLLAAGIVAVGVAFVVEDEAEVTVASVPTRLLLRRLVRLGVSLPLVAVLWTLLLWHGDGDWTVPTLVLAALGMLAAAVAARYGAVAGAMVPPALIVAAQLLPARLELLDGSPAASARWLALLAVGIAAFCAASRDPAHQWRPLQT